MAIQDPHPLNFVDLRDKNFQADTKTLLLSILVFILILISTFSLIYFLYICIRRSRLAMAGATVTPQCPSPPLPGLDKATINCLPVVSYGSSHFTDSVACKMGECSICLGHFQEGDKVKVLPTCHHGFHSECVDKWLHNRPSCPLCRACVVRVDSCCDLDIP